MVSCPIRSRTARTNTSVLRSVRAPIRFASHVRIQTSGESKTPERHTLHRFNWRDWCQALTTASLVRSQELSASKELSFERALLADQRTGGA